LMDQGFTSVLKTPDTTIIFVTDEKAREIRADQAACMGCLSACRFSNWATNETGSTGKKTDPRSYCIQKTLQDRLAELLIRGSLKPGDTIRVGRSGEYQTIDGTLPSEAGQEPGTTVH